MFLASDKASYITGQIINVDGGLIKSCTISKMKPGTKINPHNGDIDSLRLHFPVIEDEGAWLSVRGRKRTFPKSSFRDYWPRAKKKKNWENHNSAKFICCLSLYWPDENIFSSTGEIKGKIINTKRGNKGFGYDPIFIPTGYQKTFGEMDHELKISIDHRFKAFKKLKFFFD